MKIWKKYSRAISYTHRAAWSVALILLPRNSANGKGFSWFINVFSFRKQTTWLLFCSDINNKEDLPLNHQQQLAHLHTPGSHQSSQVNNITDGLTDWVTDKARQWSDLGPLIMFQGSLYFSQFTNATSIVWDFLCSISLQQYFGPSKVRILPLAIDRGASLCLGV